MPEPECTYCKDKMFVRDQDGEVSPCPKCDSVGAGEGDGND